MDSNGYQITLQHLAPGVKQERNPRDEIISDLSALVEALEKTSMRAAQIGLEVDITSTYRREMGVAVQYPQFTLGVSLIVKR